MDIFERFLLITLKKVELIKLRERNIKFGSQQSGTVQNPCRRTLTCDRETYTESLPHQNPLLSTSILCHPSNTKCVFQMKINGVRPV